jgi:hypothetical protein
MNPSAIPSHRTEPGTRIPASVQGTQKGCLLRQNHIDPAHNTHARDFARVSSSNSWNRVPDRSLDNPIRLRF